MTRLLQVVLALVVSLFAHDVQGQVVKPSGLYALDDHLKNGSLANFPPYTQGVTLRVHWFKLQPTPDTFNWTDLDASIRHAEASGLQVQIGVAAGVSSPHWLYDKGVQQYSMLWDLEFSYKNCSWVYLPIPWDETYLSYWSAFHKKLAERYDNNSTIVGIKVAGINAQTMELLLPSRNVSDCSAVPWDPTPEWIKLGYTPQKIIDTFSKILDMYYSTYNHTTMVLMTSDFPWPGIDNNGKATGSLDMDLSQTLAVQFATSTTNASKIELGNNGLCAKWYWVPPAAIPKDIRVGAQALWSITNDPTCRMNRKHHPCGPKYVMNQTLINAVNISVSYFEVYLIDLVNPIFADLLSAFAARYPNGNEPLQLTDDSVHRRG